MASCTGDGIDVPEEGRPVTECHSKARANIQQRIMMAFDGDVVSAEDKVCLTSGIMTAQHQGGKQVQSGKGGSRCHPILFGWTSPSRNFREHAFSSG
jgi:hypothetical protein